MSQFNILCKLLILSFGHTANLSCIALTVLSKKNHFLDLKKEFLIVLPCLQIELW